MTVVGVHCIATYGKQVLLMFRPDGLVIFRDEVSWPQQVALLIALYQEDTRLGDAKVVSFVSLLHSSILVAPILRNIYHIWWYRSTTVLICRWEFLSNGTSFSENYCLSYVGVHYLCVHQHYHEHPTCT